VDPHLRETRTSRRKFVRRVLRGGERAAQEGIPNYFREFIALHSVRRVVHRIDRVTHIAQAAVHSLCTAPVDDVRQGGPSEASRRTDSRTATPLDADRARVASPAAA